MSNLKFHWLLFGLLVDDGRYLAFTSKKLKEDYLVWISKNYPQHYSKDVLERIFVEESKRIGVRVIRGKKCHT